jgi:uncharacterized protein
MPLIQSSFRPAWFARGGHLQTLWAPLVLPRVQLPIHRERVELPDGDFVDLDWCRQPGEGMTVLLLHGLEGSSRSPYIRGMMRALQRAGLTSVAMHFRGCSGEPNRLARGYHSGDTEDLKFLVRHLHERCSCPIVAAIGYSLGANVLLKWLGETGPANPLLAAAAVSPPFDLGASADRISRGLSRIYHAHLLRCLRRTVLRKAGAHGPQLPVSIERLRRVRTIRQFDDQFTAPVHGFAGADDYYRKSSCRHYLATIAVPTLIVHARNDPFTPACHIPADPDLSESVTLELSDDGGHVGFIGASNLWTASYWLEERLPQFLIARSTPSA